MKPASFIYHRPTSLDEILGLLDEHGDEAKVLAGGQSLVAAMNFRLARPSMLIDANNIPELSGISVDGNHLVIGALTRHATFHKPVVNNPVGDLLSRVVQSIAHYPIRQRGTFGGSLCHADPASEWCLTSIVLDAEMLIESKAGKRRVSAKEFFKGTFTTAVKSNELLTQIRLPLGSPAFRGGFYEFSRRKGDFALAMSLVALELDGSRIRSARIGLGGVADKPIRLSSIEAGLIGQRADASTFEAVAAEASNLITPTSDIHGTSEYRKDLIKPVLVRALTEAAA
ncbi:xanthine dehydrogenase family protein subunit M [Bradyrhizobium sp. CCGUVB1N3]|uniref:FAD binding domain-containing protein n=1 Tax=Bradyrhizobium sp. CCGUVB1N3 TaxID=2949629 RepID=UPI0020B461C0|nr:xanthine dehydrogenase family protein subunit M [Bradyrhizobium sp. CCGUVB1N3]MCP3476734.1 xanthine dehydrogenase family protein subunit M [Bradyrhizobium sp. CCGUVB1N3]